MYKIETKKLQLGKNNILLLFFALSFVKSSDHHFLDGENLYKTFTQLILFHKKRYILNGNVIHKYMDIVNHARTMSEDNLF